MKMKTSFAVVSALAALAIAPAVHALPADQYLKLRRQNRFDASLTYSKMMENPSASLNRVLELKGIVSGAVRREQNVGFILTLEDKQNLTLTAPLADAALLTEMRQQKLRVLARVIQPDTAEKPPLEVLAAAYDAEVLPLEKREAAAAPAPPKSRRSTGKQASMPSRGLTVRPMEGQGESVSDFARKYLTPEAQGVYPIYRDFIWKWNKRLTMPEVDAIAVSLLYYCQQYKVDPRLATAMIIAESDFRIETTSHKGAMGLGQIMPDEARELRITNPYDPIQNVGAAVKLLRQKLDLYREPGTPDGQLTWRQIELAMAAYNAGAGAVRKYGGIPPYRETQNYVRKIIKLYSEFSGNTKPQ